MKNGVNVRLAFFLVLFVIWEKSGNYIHIGFHAIIMKHVMVLHATHHFLWHCFIFVFLNSAYDVVI